MVHACTHHGSWIIVLQPPLLWIKRVCDEHKKGGVNMEGIFEFIAELAFDLLGEGLFKKLPWLTHVLLGSLILASLIFAYVFRSHIIIVVMMLLFALMFTLVFIALKKKDEDM